MSRIIDVRHLGLKHEGEPVVEYEPENGDGQHVTTLFRGCESFRNVWPISDMEPDVRQSLESLRWP